jgi:hypothetical protein
MKLISHHKIDAPVDAVWDLMGEQFAEIGEWSDTVIKSSLDGPIGEGAVRTCELKPTPAASGTIQEMVTLFDRSGQHFAFDIITGLPGFMRRVNSDWKLEAAGPSSTHAINTLTIQVAWWMRPMLPLIRGQFRQTIKGFIPEIELAANRPRAAVEPMVAAQ